MLLKDTSGELGFIATCVVNGVIGGVLGVISAVQNDGDINSIVSSAFVGVISGVCNSVGGVLRVLGAVMNGVVTMAADVDSQRAQGNDVNYWAALGKGVLSGATSLISYPGASQYDEVTELMLNSAANMVGTSINTRGSSAIDNYLVSTRQPQKANYGASRVNTSNARRNYSNRLRLERRNQFLRTKLDRV